ncbi:phage holin family protein [Micromonospora sp. KC207]|uniref:phage holin family protein n=1 Tax=Micromonospora sp. KC207 TaxID=2530377 RepID=UPI001052B5FF|nr:phage holin family protein [Micromonospora sp. KC207]TDC67097.1 phage holin family protein [Micromonospora sp. KC207]
MSASARGRAEAAPDRTQASLGELLGNVTRDVSTLVRQEVQLAKAEVRQEMRAAGQAAGMVGGAALAGFMTLLFLSFALWWALANVMDQGWAALIVAGIWAVIGAALFTVARGRLRRVKPGLPRTTETVRQVPGAFTHHRNAERNDGDSRSR